MRFATGFWVFLTSSSVLLDSGSLAGSAAFPGFIAAITKTAQKRLETGVIQEAFIDSFFTVGSAPFMAIPRSAIRAAPIETGRPGYSSLRLARWANQRREDWLGHPVERHDALTSAAG